MDNYYRMRRTARGYEDGHGVRCWVRPDGVVSGEVVHYAQKYIDFAQIQVDADVLSCLEIIFKRDSPFTVTNSDELPTDFVPAVVINRRGEEGESWRYISRETVPKELDEIFQRIVENRGNYSPFTEKG